MNELLNRIREHKLVSIIRGADPTRITDIVSALYDGGIRLVEVTLNSENALGSIRQLIDRFGDRMLVGAGTVLDASAAVAAMEAGARFIISPSLDHETIAVTKHAGAVSIPGAFTPTEILKAHGWGADIVKIFPATAGPGYIRDIRGPLGHIPMMPTGGITVENIRDYQEAGGVAFGIGSSLVKSNPTLTDKDLYAITERAKQFAKAIHGSLGQT